jgi:predicted ATPase
MQRGKSVGLGGGEKVSDFPSGGMLRFLWLSTVLLAPDPPPLVLLDESEVSLHPELIKLLAGLLQDASVRGQIIAATHSPDLVRWLQPQQVLVLDKIEGRTQFTWADSMDLEEWLEEYTWWRRVRVAGGCVDAF